MGIETRSPLQKEQIKKAHAKMMEKGFESNKDPETNLVRGEKEKLTKAIKRATYPEMVDYTRQLFFAPDPKTGKPYFKLYLENFFKEALEDPAGKCSQMLSSGVINENLWHILDDNLQTEKKTVDIDYEKYRILKTLYKQQKEIYEDENRYLFAICSRRVGKSTLAARLLVADALTPNHNGLYVGVKSDQAKGIGCAMVLKLLSDLGYTQLTGRENFTDNGSIEYRVHTDPGGAVIEFNNGSKITFRGNSKAGEADKYQGFMYTFCIVDEVQSQPCLEYLLNQILGAAMVDKKDSRQLLIGTPPRIPNTYCEKLWKMKDNVYSKFHWDMSKNPYLENDTETEIDIACKRAGVTRDSAFIKREYYGEFVYDTDALIFKNYKTYKELPKDFLPTKLWIGVDWGFVDHNAIVSVAVDYYSKKAYVIDQVDFGRADSDEQERAVEKAYYNAIDFLRNYKIKDTDHYITIVADTNQPATVLKLQRTGLPVIKAYKPNVEVTTEQLATEMRTGRCLIPEDGILKEEADRTVWKRNDDGQVLFEIDDLVYHPNALHALRYCMIYWTDEWTSYESSNLIEMPEKDHFIEDDDIEKPFETITVEEEWR